MKENEFLHISSESKCDFVPFTSPIFSVVTSSKSTEMTDHDHQAKFWANPVHHPI